MKNVATDIIDLPKDQSNVDPIAWDRYKAFRESVEEIFDYYGFVDKHHHDSGQSKYYYYAHISQIESGNVPKYVKVRVSCHDEQHKSEEHLQEIKEETKRILDRIKIPKTKMKQRYMPMLITVNTEKGFTTYEEALDYVESLVRDLFEDLHLDVDLSEYDEIGPW